MVEIADGSIVVKTHETLPVPEVDIPSACTYLACLLLLPDRLETLPMTCVPPKWSIPPDVKWIEVNGYPMAYQDRGAGSPLVLVHGSFCDYRIWPDQLEPFSKQHRVLNVSLRHFFPEVWDGVGYDFSFAQHADDLAAFIHNLSLGPVHLLGV
ncbi:MAG: alpha/beta hydrolase, partial [Bradyrhizobium sp.]